MKRVDVQAPPDSVKGSSRREEILRNAALLFSERGYQGTTIRDIADRMDLLPGSLYSHIESKEALLYELLVRYVSRLTVLLENVVGTESSARDRLRLGLLSLLQYAEELGQARPLLFECRSLDDQHRKEIQSGYEYYEGLWERLVKEGIEHGEFRSMDVGVARIILLQMDRWIFSGYRPGERLGPEEMADRLSELILQGFESTRSDAATP